MKKPERFVIIDDDPGHNFLCNLAVKRATGSTDIQSFTDPESGVAFIRSEYSGPQEKPTVLFLDINMPVMTGWDVLDVINGYEEGIKKQLSVYILSSSINPDDKERAHVNPLVKDYLEKPLTIEKLREMFAIESVA